MRKYEVLIIVDPEVDDRQVPGLIDNHVKVVTNGGGTVDTINLMGRRRLAYEINKKADGVYVDVYCTADPATVAELNRRMTIDEKILRTKVFRADAK